MILLTSFKRFHDEELGFDGFSVAVYQPAWYPALPKLKLFDIRRPDGQWTMPRNFASNSDPDLGAVRAYHDALLAVFDKRWEGQSGYEKRAFFARIELHDEAWCCWCPYEKAAKRQMDDYGSFVCHTMVIETFLKGLGIDVVRDEDRRKDMVMLDG